MKIDVFSVVILVLIALLVAVVLMVPAGSKPRSTVDYAPECALCVKLVAIALESYHEAHGTFPPAVVYDPDGRAMHSWRALVLPHLGLSYHREYDFSQPWNSEENLKFGTYAPDCLRCWKCQGESNAHTTVLAVTGDGTCWPASKSIARSDITDGPRDTVQLIGLPDTGIHWLEPRDWRLDDVRRPGQHGNGNYVAFADGSVGFLPLETSIRPFATIASGDKVDREAIGVGPR